MPDLPQTLEQLTGQTRDVQVDPFEAHRLEEPEAEVERRDGEKVRCAVREGRS